MEPTALITALALSFARGAGSKAMAGLGSAFGMGGAPEVNARLLAIETALDGVLRAPHQENLRAGTVLLRESMRQQDVAERRRRLLVAEDRLIVAASDAHLGLEERAGAALLTALSAAERASPNDCLRWLRQCGGLLSCLVDDRRYHQKFILATTAPAWVAKDVDRQRASQRFKVLLGTWSPELEPLRLRVRAEAHDALDLWNAIRPFLAAAERPASYPTLRIDNHEGTYVRGAPTELLDLLVITDGVVGTPVSLAAHRLTVSQVLVRSSQIRVSARLERDPVVELYYSPYESSMDTMYARLGARRTVSDSGADWSSHCSYEPRTLLVCVQAPTVTATTDFTLTHELREQTEALCFHLPEGFVQVPLGRG